MCIFFNYIFLEWVNLVSEESCNPSRAERLQIDNLVCLEKYIKEFTATYVYTHRVSKKEPLTEKIRKSMTENVKSAAYNNLLDKKIKYLALMMDNLSMEINKF